MVPGYSNSASINVIFQSYSLSLSEVFDNNPLIAYIQNSPTSIYAYYSSDVNTYSPQTAWHAGLLAGYAEGNVSGSSLSLGAYNQDDAKGTATALMLFTPKKTSIVNFTGIGYYSGPDASWGIELLDTTTNQVLLNLNRGSTMYAPSHQEYSYTFSLNSSDIYFLEADVFSPGTDEARSSVDINFVPEPATILLLSLGLIGVAGMRRKFKG
jgi:hypothetical protein